MLLRIFVPKQAVGANKVYFDLFIPGASTWQAEIVSLQPVVSGAAAVTGTLGVDLHLTRTTSVGTGGTAALYGGNSLTGMQISNAEGGAEVDATAISGRMVPAGGAAPGAVLSAACVFPEETNAGTYMPGLDLASSRNDFIPGVIVKPNGGIRVVQGAVASVGNIGFNLIVNMTPVPIPT